MIKIAIIAIVIAACVYENEAVRCHVGYSAADLPLAMSVRDVECGKGFDHCVTLKYVLDGMRITQGNCATRHGQATCLFMKNSQPAMTQCTEDICTGDHCNSDVFEAEQVERKRVGAYKNTLKCTTGLQTDFPNIPFASPNVPFAVDECFPGTDKCVTMEYDYLYKFESTIATSSNEFKLPFVQKMCNRPYVPCDAWCILFETRQTIANCKSMCCKGHNCNAWERNRDRSNQSYKYTFKTTEGRM